jgi:hypothetical protein
MRHRRLGWGAASLAAVLLVFAAATAEAHPGRRLARPPAASAVVVDVETPRAPVSAPPVSPAPELPTLTQQAVAPLSLWLLAILALAMAGVVAGRSRWLAVTTLAVILMAFLAESTVHSVHHLGDPRGTARCQVLLLAQHVSGHEPPATPVASRPMDAGPVLAAWSESLASDVPPRPDLGRAPPLAA